MKSQNNAQLLFEAECYDPSQEEGRRFIPLGTFETLHEAFRSCKNHAGREVNWATTTDPTEWQSLFNPNGNGAAYTVISYRWSVALKP